MIVVGAGPAGCLCAKEAASEGVRVDVWERKKTIGEPVQCTGLVSLRGLNELNVEYKDAVLNECRGARIFSPRGQVIEVRKQRAVAAVLDRAAFDRIVAEEAESAGANITLGKEWSGEKADVLVGADGANSSILRSFSRKHAFLHAYQVLADLKRDTDFVELHFGPWSQGFFAWVVPVDERQCRVGIAVSEGNPRLALAKFASARGMTLEYGEEYSGLIPLFENAPAVLSSNVAVVGDAAAQVKASTGGGIAIGGYCARILGQTIAKDAPLSTYEKAWRSEFERDLGLHARIKNVFSRMSPDDMEYVWRVALEEGVGKIASEYGDMERVQPFVSALLSKPSLLLKLGRFASLL
jgi:geranylgeranyl reductase family protein